MGKADVIVCFIWILMAAFVAFQSIRLGLGQWVDPGSGFLPFCLSIVLGLLAFILLISRVFKRKENHQTKNEAFRVGPQWKKALYLMVGSLIYVTILWETLGYLISTAIFLFFLLKFVGSQSSVRSVIISIVATVISYLIFQTWLQCMLPKGLLKSFNF